MGLATNRAVVGADGLYGTEEANVRPYDFAEVDRLRRLLERMDPDPASRRGMRPGRALCPRHVWAAAVVEYELAWEPRKIGVLGEELLSRALKALTAPSRPRRLRRYALRDRAECPVCAGVTGDPPDGRVRPEAERSRAERVNACARFATMAERSRGIWTLSTCPPCAGGRGPLCRPHLLELPGGFTGWTVVRLRDVHDRLRDLIATTAPGGPSPTPAAEAGLIEALGFIAGWADAPLQVKSAW